MMSIFQRFKTTLRADAHGFVDALEDEALLLKQHLRDAEAAVQSKRASVVRLDAERKRLANERERAAADVVRFERDAELALAADREDLSRYALKLLLPRQRLIERIDLRYHQIDEERAELERKLDEQQAALEELRGRVHAYLTDREAGSSAVAVEPVTDEQVELELLRRKRERTSAAGNDPEPRDG